MNWLEFALLHADEPRTVQVDGAEVGPCLVRNEVIFCPPDTVAAPGARVTLPGGRAVRVRDAVFMDSCGTGLPDHWQLDVDQPEPARHGGQPVRSEKPPGRHDNTGRRGYCPGTRRNDRGV